MITLKRLKETLHYDPSTGVFTCLVDRGPSVLGSVAGTLEKESGYQRVRIDGKDYRLHRLAFLYVDGYLPEFDVDHVDGVRSNNSWNNLRHVSRSCNMQNQQKQQGRTSVFVGVSYLKRSDNWTAYVKINKKKIHLGNHVDEISAVLARVTFEDWCDKWKCNSRNVNKIKLRELGWKV